jgi:uncharacterized protein YecE (DUF72 family)
VPKVGQLAENAREIHILMNNNAQDYAITNARQMMRLIRENLPDSEVAAASSER